MIKMTLYCIFIIFVHIQFVRSQDTNCTYNGTLCLQRSDVQALRPLAAAPPPEPHTILILGGTAAYLTCCVVIFALSLVYRRYKLGKLRKVSSVDSAYSSHGDGPEGSPSNVVSMAPGTEVHSTAEQDSLNDGTVRLTVQYLNPAHCEQEAKESHPKDSTHMRSLSLPDSNFGRRPMTRLPIKMKRQSQCHMQSLQHP